MTRSEEAAMSQLHPGKLYLMSQRIVAWKFPSDDACREHFDSSIGSDDDKRKSRKICHIDKDARVMYIGEINFQGLFTTVGQFKVMYKFLHGKEMAYITFRNCVKGSPLRIW